MAILFLQLSVILWLVAPALIILARYAKEESLPIKWLSQFVVFDFLLQGTIFFKIGEYFFLNVLVHLLLIWPLVILVYLQKSEIKTVREFFDLTDSMRKVALIILFVPLVVYLLTASSIAREVKEVHLSTLHSIQQQDEPLLYMLQNTNADGTLAHLPEQIPQLLEGSVRVVVLPHQARVVVTGKRWSQDFIYFYEFGQWQLTSNRMSSFIGNTNPLDR